MKPLTSVQHPLVKRFVKLRKDRKARLQFGSAVIEGKKLIVENSSLIKTLFVADPHQSFTIPKGAGVYQVTHEIIQKISGVKSPEGVIAEVKIPQLKLEAPKRLLVLENLNDPGNLGTLIRSALAFGWDGVFFLGDCCDPYNDKAIRASKGAVFRLPLIFGNIEYFASLIKDNKLKVWIADLKGEDAKRLVFENGIALVLGNEANGPTQEALALGRQVTIPMEGAIESLNVAIAGAILLYQMSEF